MITIGSFTRTSDGAYEGAIRTFTLNAKAVRFRAIEQPAAKSPDFRITAGDIELGAAWKRPPRRNATTCRCASKTRDSPNPCMWSLSTHTAV